MRTSATDVSEAKSHFAMGNAEEVSPGQQQLGELGTGTPRCFP